MHFTFLVIYSILKLLWSPNIFDFMKRFLLWYHSYVNMNYSSTSECYKISSLYQRFLCALICVSCLVTYPVFGFSALLSLSSVSTLPALPPSLLQTSFSGPLFRTFSSSFLPSLYLICLKC